MIILELPGSFFKPFEMRRFEIDVETLGEAVRAAEEITGYSIIRTDYGKHFFVREGLGFKVPEPDATPCLDIHVERGEDELCAKHDYSLRLLDGDVITFCTLIC